MIEGGVPRFAKSLMERGRAACNLNAFLAPLPKASHWDARLHILKCFRYAPSADAGQAESVRTLPSGGMTLTRVRALDACARIADIRPKMHQEARKLASVAPGGQAAGLRARARHLQAVVVRWA
ncbi:MAG: hypothetical protein GDA53_05600 [Rhodobacteraceae bacterium]|nr:hypothetical protein [Paracoccaceae bacterium]